MNTHSKRKKVTALDTAQLKHMLLESDYQYFEYGAIVEKIDGAVIARMEGLEEMAAACVVQRLNLSKISGNAEHWLQATEQKLKLRGCSYARFYLTDTPPELQNVLRRRGYHSRIENGLILPCDDKFNAGLNVSDSEISLRAVDNKKLWALKLNMHEACQLYPDGHSTKADQWVDLERRKANAGLMKPYLITQNNTVCGAISFIACGQLIRLKNLVMHPAFRRQGIGRGAVNHIVKQTCGQKKKVAGFFAVKDGKGEMLYKSCGFYPIVCQQEWIKSLN